MINTNKLAEQAGLLGPASRVGDAHAATERFAILHRAEIIAELTQGVEMPEAFPAGYIAKSEYFHTDKTLRETVAAAVLRKDAEIALQKISDFGQMQELLAERDALRAESDHYNKLHIIHNDRANAAEAENERLQTQTNKRGALAIANGIRMERTEAENERLREALERLAKLGNGDRYGNSIGNEIAQAALKGQT